MKSPHQLLNQLVLMVATIQIKVEKKKTNKETVSCFDPCSVQNVVNKVGTFEIFSCEKEKKGDKTKTNNKQQNTKYAVDFCTIGWLQFISHYLHELSIFQLKIYL